MAISAEALDVILRVQNLKAFQAEMASGAASVREVGAASKEAGAESAAMSGSLSKQMGLMGLMTKATKGLVVATVVAGVEAYKMGVNFDKQMTMIQTEAGAGAGEIAKLRGQVLDLAGPLGQSPEELAKGLYHLESVGMRGQTALHGLKVAADLASISGADLEQTTTALAGAWRVGIKGAGDLNHLMGILNATAGTGNMRMQNLVEALGTGILPAAKNAGMSIQDTGAAIATLTDLNVPASSAAAQLATALHFLYAPSDKAKKALGELHLSQKALVDDLNGPRGLQGALSDLQQHLETFSKGDRAKYLEAFGAILPGGRGRVLQSLMNNLDVYAQKQEHIGMNANKVTAHVAEAHQTAAFKIKSAWDSVQADLIRLYDTFKGPGTDAVTFLIGLMGGFVLVLTAVGHHLTLVRDIVVPMAAMWLAYHAALIAVSVAQNIVAASRFIKYWYDLAKAEGVATAATFAFNLMLDANPAVLIALAIMALVAVLVIAAMHFGWVKNAASNAFRWITHAGEDAFHWIQHHWPLLLVIMTGPFGLLAVFVIKHFNTIKHAVTDVLNFVIGAINTMIKAYDSLPGFIRPTGKIGTIGLIGVHHAAPHVAAGAAQDRIGGPRVVPTPAPRSVRGSASTGSLGAVGLDRPIHVVSQVLLDRRVVGEAVNRFNADQKARRG